MQITIDGPAGAGKSTVAKRLASNLRYAYIDTGAMYRAVTCAAILYKIDPSEEPKLIQIAQKLKPEFNNDLIEYYIDHLFLTPFIRSNVVNDNVSEVSVHAGVRYAMVDLQRKIANQSPHGSVMEGRDTGSTVLPNADLKIFLTATLEERVNRRYNESIAKGENIKIEDVNRILTKRDKIDSERAVSPLTIPENAVIIDSTSKSIDDVLKEIERIIKEKSGD